MYTNVCSFVLIVCFTTVNSVNAQDNSQEKSPDRASSTKVPSERAPSEAVDPTGTWKWEQRFGGDITGRLQLKDGKLTGTYQAPRRSRGGPPAEGLEDPVAIVNAKLEGDKISFAVVRQFGDRDFTTTYVGVISGDEIAGEYAFRFGSNLRESAWMAQRVNVTPVQESEATPATDTLATVTAAIRQTDDQPKSTGSISVPQPQRIPAAREQTEGPYVPQAILPGGIVMPLYGADSPHLNKDRINEPETYSLSGSVHGRINSIVNIHNPSIEVHFASPSMNTGTVVILAAGGGHRTLNVGTESADFVPFFYNFGVNTVILRNRLRSDGYEPKTDAVRDALQAIRLVRKFSEQWKIDSNRIGIMGFSAGAELSAPAAVQFEQFDKDNADTNDPLAGTPSRPDFVGIIYPGPTPFTRDPDTAVPLGTPPAFITCAGAGDRIHAIWATDYFSAMLRASIPNVEMHIYGNGRHPGDKGMTGGLTHRSGIPMGTWQDRFIEWFDDLGFLSESGVQTKAAADTQNFLSRRRR